MAQASQSHGCASGRQPSASRTTPAMPMASSALVWMMKTPLLGSSPTHQTLLLVSKWKRGQAAPEGHVIAFAGGAQLEELEAGQVDQPIRSGREHLRLAEIGGSARGQNHVFDAIACGRSGPRLGLDDRTRSRSLDPYRGSSNLDAQISGSVRPASSSMSSRSRGLRSTKIAASSAAVRISSAPSTAPPRASTADFAAERS